MQLIGNFSYRPEIDGLRALAVGAVVLYHAGLGVSGGFTGVDIFFVISGYLITSLLIRDLEDGRFRLAGFWERRVRRILPAAAVMVAATLVAGWFLLLPSDLAGLGRSAVAHALLAANFHFRSTTNYFGGVAEEKPLLHTWSLAVEEQFYLVLPVLLLLLFRSRRARTRGGLAAVFGFGFLASLALSHLLLPRMPVATFYLLPTRAWEFLAGSLVALVPAGALPRSRTPRELLCAAGLAGMLLPMAVYGSDTPFPGLAALPPCLGAAAFILGSTPLPTAPPPHLARLFSWRPLVFVGMISYSLYLWHWPLIAFTRYWALEPLSLPHRWSLVAASLVLALLSWRFVETPFRTRRLAPTRHGLFVRTGVALGATAAGALVLVLQHGFPHRFSDSVRTIDAVASRTRAEDPGIRESTLDDARHGRFLRLGAHTPDAVSLLVWGDSHALSILPAVDALARDRGAGVVAAWHSSTAPVIGYTPEAGFSKFSLGTDSPAYNQAVLDHIVRHRIPAVLLAARWSGYFAAESDSHRGTPAAFARGLLETVSCLRQAGARPYVLLEVPNHRAPVPKVLLSHAVLGTDPAPYASTPDLLAHQNREMTRLIPDLQAAGAEIIDVSPLLLDPEEQRYRMESQGQALYSDAHHLTRDGALLVGAALAPVFDGQTEPSSLSAPQQPGGR